MSISRRGPVTPSTPLFQIPILRNNWKFTCCFEMADKQSKNKNIKLMEDRAQSISKDDILEMIRKGKPFTLLKELIINKKEHLSNKFTPLISNNIFVLSDSEDSTENEDKDE